MRRIGQNTGTSKIGNNVIVSPISTDLMHAYLHQMSREQKRLGVPEFVLRESPDKWLELVPAVGGELHSLFALRVYLRRQKSQQQIQIKNSEAISHNIESLEQVHPDEVEQHYGQQGSPSVRYIRRALVQVILNSPLSLLHKHRDPMIHDSRFMTNLIPSQADRSSPPQPPRSPRSTRRTPSYKWAPACPSQTRILVYLSKTSPPC